MQKKICMLGSFAVGKTSLVRRFVHSLFDERYHTTVGVRIDKKVVAVDGADVTLMLWDIHGDDEFQNVRLSYLRGASGYLLVADGTRRDTIDRVYSLNTITEKTAGSVPFLLLLNKADLEDEWAIGPEDLEWASEKGWTILKTSAKTGAGVEEAFLELAGRTMGT